MRKLPLAAARPGRADVCRCRACREPCSRRRRVHLPRHGDARRRRRHARRPADERQDRADPADRHRHARTRRLLLLPGHGAGTTAGDVEASGPPRRLDAGHARSLRPPPRVCLASGRKGPRLPVGRRRFREGLRVPGSIPTAVRLPERGGGREECDRRAVEGLWCAGRRLRLRQSRLRRRRARTATRPTRRAYQSSATSTAPTSARWASRRFAFSARIRTGSTATTTAWAASRPRLGGLPGRDPTFECLDSFLRPSAVARHRAFPQSVQNRVGVPADILVRPEVEREGHRSSILLTEQRLDVGVEAERLVCRR